MLNKIKKGLLALLVAVSAIFTSTSLTTFAAEDTYIIDDVDERFVYSGNGDANEGGWESWSDGTNKPEVSEHWSNSAGATLDITFKGTKIELYGKADPSHAMFSVSIDDGEAVEVDAYAPETIFEKKLYESETLEDGTHVAHIEVLGKRNEASTGSGNVYGVQFVYAKVHGVEEVVEPEFPGYTDVDDALTTSTNELFKIQYAPADAWYAESGYPNLFLNGTDHYSDKDVEDAGYTMEFIGTGIEIYGSKNVDHSNGDVYIDGVKVGEVTSGLESGATQHKQKLFETNGLENTKHTLEVKRTSAGKKAMQVDVIRVFHEELDATEIALSQSEVRLGVGQTTQLSVSYEPWNAKTPEIEWSSADKTIVEVSEDGMISAVAEEASETTVTATVKGSNVSADVKVIVDPTIQSLLAYIGNEKILDIQEDYDDLIAAEAKTSSEKTAWKGDTLNSKIVVATKDSDVHGVEVSASDFETESGDVLSADNIDIKWLKEIDANDGRNMGGSVHAYPDMIHKGGKSDIDATSVKFAWVNINVPENTVPGTYTGTITVNADELKTPIDLVYTVEVLDLVQPALEATEIQVWQHPFSVANYYLGLGNANLGGTTNEVDEDFYFTEEHFNLMRASMEEYASIGGHDAVANIVEEAWNHQSYYNDLSMVKWTKKSDGSWEFDYDWYDKWINFMIDCGVLDPENGIGQIKCYSIVPWNNQIAYYDEASQKVVKESHTPGSEAWKAMWEPFLEDFMAHSKEKGWFEITYISMDERGLDQLRPAVDMIESVTDEEGNHFKISSALNYAAPQYYDFTDRIDDISINLGNTKDEQQMRDLSDHRREKGLVTTLYTCTGDYPSNFTISDPGDNYWDILYSMTLGTDGYMRWAWDNYVYNMHENITYRYWEPGDGWFIYPVEREDVNMKETVPFYSTPRYELFKQGIRDAAKAKYLMAQSDEMNKEITELMYGMDRPESKTYHGSAVAKNEEERMLVHSETDRVYNRITEIARDFSNVVADYTAVDAAIAKANALNPEDYVDFTAVTKAIEAVVRDLNITKQAEVDAMATAIEEAIANLQEKPEEPANKNELDKVMKEAEELNAEDYTKESYEVLVEALEAAKAVAKDESATQEEVDAALAKLTAAIDGLQPVEPTDPDKPTTPEEDNKPGEDEKGPDSGDNTNVGGLLTLLGLAGMAIAYSTRKRTN